MADRSYELYLNDLRAIPALGGDELSRLLPLASAGDEQARWRIVEGMQHYIADLAGSMGGKGIPAGDLVQEGNVALLLVLQEYVSGNFKELVRVRALESMQALVDDAANQKNIHEEMIARINVLRKVSEVLAEELDREPTLAELAAKMKMTEDEVQDIMQETIRAMSVSPDAEI